MRIREEIESGEDYVHNFHVFRIDLIFKGMTLCSAIESTYILNIFDLLEKRSCKLILQGRKHSILLNEITLKMSSDV